MSVFYEKRQDIPNYPPNNINVAFMSMMRDWDI